MKSLSYIFALLLIVLYSCKEEDHPYVGYIVIDRAVVEAAGGSATMTAQTDLSDPIQLEVDQFGAEWCSVSVNGKQITVTATEANPSSEEFRTATVNVRCGTRVTTFTVLQKHIGQEYLEFDWSKFSATGSDVQAGDGGGYPSLFKEDRTNFWHSQYSPATPNPHWLLIDMQKELPVSMVRIARRYYAANGNNYPTVKTMEVYAGINKDDLTLVGGFTFALPWTAPDGTIVNGNSPKVPPYEDVIFNVPVTARYVKLIITETNNTTGVCQVAYFKAFEKI
ncbi:discoidin domain-containing protein [Dysgonomonas sp. GY75]|uniref:discoidin domain-containing protein n=1 Tax=Dysgonomonas sp. GY75 TaxID=2780419 RepID=UPI00188436B6|nr:discoidin domain-containing protein [Dysgonomonas sp. GY75]MBF0647920.1 discoidin domain-containing protein [Dysgonomonas sp. GY75]